MRNRSAIEWRIENRKSKGGVRKVAAFGLVLVMSVAVLAAVPYAKAELVLLDEVNIGDPISEGSKISGWSHVWDTNTEPKGSWGGFDAGDTSGISGAVKTLRTVWAAEDEDENWATIKLNAKTQSRLLVVRALDGYGDDSFVVYVNGDPVYPYTDSSPIWDSPEVWTAHEIPVKCAGEVVVKIVSTADKWDYFDPWGQLGVNYVRLYGVGGFDMYGYNYESRLYVGDYDGADRYFDGKYWGRTGDYVDDRIVMKWSIGWDNARFGDAEMGPDAWCTNHVVGDYLGDDGAEHHYTWFVKIVWIGADQYDPTNPYCLWNEFMIVEEVYNDPYGGYGGLQWKCEPGPGLG